MNIRACLELMEMGLVLGFIGAIIWFVTLLWLPYADLKGHYLDNPRNRGWVFAIHWAAVYCLLFALLAVGGGLFLLLPLLLWDGLVKTWHLIWRLF